MQIIDFTIAHIEQATLITKQNYAEARRFVPVLPPIDKTPDLTPFAENNFGVAAFDNGNMVGFMCSVSPVERPFQIPDILGAYVPLLTHGSDYHNRAALYASMYESASKKWVAAGAVNHTIVLYAHDIETQMQFFRYRFGTHGIDAIREITGLNAKAPPEFQFAELTPTEFDMVFPLHNLLRDHFLQSPMFISFPHITLDEFRQMNEKENARYFVVKSDSEIVGYMKFSEHGETFISRESDMINLCGAYLLSEFRGKGVYDALLSYAASTLALDGYKRIGVDFESFNPTARGFWLKHFTPYTTSVVRRIS